MVEKALVGKGPKVSGIGASGSDKAPFLGLCPSVRNYIKVDI